MRCTDRTHWLHTKTKKEREMWTDAFKYVVESTHLVQDLLETDTIENKKKMKRATRNMWNTMIPG